jgi:ketosteroid isomerase-like protein
MTIPQCTRADIRANGTDVEKYEFLARLQAAEYDRLRECYAEDMHIRVTTLDTEVAERRRSAEKVRPLMLSDPKPWPECCSMRLRHG